VNFSLIIIGLVKLIVGFGLGGLGILLAWKLLSRLVNSDGALKDNSAAGTLHAGMLISLAILGRNALSATFDTIDLTLQSGITLPSLLKVAIHSSAHVLLSLTLGAALLSIAVALFNRLTPGIDELQQVKAGNLAAALVLAAILVSFALLASPGLEALLAGFIPFPTLPSKTGIAP
jgi:hypothetical protein